MKRHARHARRRRPALRQGIASLELVLSFPFLLLSAALAFAFASASIAATGSAVKARHDAWKARGGARAASPFDPRGGAGLDLITRRATERFRVSSPLAFVGRTAGSKNAVMAGPWDHDDAPFAEPGSPFTPHLEHLEQLVNGAVAGAPGLASDLNGVAEFVGIGDPGASADVSGALTAFAGPIGGADKLLSEDSGPGSFPTDKLSKVEGVGDTAASAREKSSRLAGKVPKGGSRDIGSAASLSKSAATVQNKTLQIGHDIYESVDDALNPLKTMTRALGKFIGGGKKSDGNDVDKLVDKGKKAAESLLEDVVGLFVGDKAKKAIKEAVEVMDKVEALLDSGSPFGKLARAADDPKTEDPDEFSALSADLYDKLGVKPKNP